jgi:hypothetical protein
VLICQIADEFLEHAQQHCPISMTQTYLHYTQRTGDRQRTELGEFAGEFDRFHFAVNRLATLVGRVYVRMYLIVNLIAQLCAHVRHDWTQHGC